jgi:hypothetical protein
MTLFRRTTAKGHWLALSAPTAVMFGRGGSFIPSPTKKLVCGGWL